MVPARISGKPMTAPALSGAESDSNVFEVEQRKGVRVGVYIKSFTSMMVAFVAHWRTQSNPVHTPRSWSTSVLATLVWFKSLAPVETSFCEISLGMVLVHPSGHTVFTKPVCFRHIWDHGSC